MMEGCKDTFDFGVEMALISFVYKGIGSQFCLWLPTTCNVCTKKTGIIFGTTKSVAYFDYRVCVAVFGRGRNFQ